MQAVEQMFDFGRVSRLHQGPIRGPFVRGRCDTSEAVEVVDHDLATTDCQHTFSIQGGCSPAKVRWGDAERVGKLLNADGRIEVQTARQPASAQAEIEVRDEVA